METKEFIRLLTEAEEHISQENYIDALNILYKLKEIEIKGDFDTSLTHKLYQLISNAESLLNQKKITKELSELARDHKEIDFNSLSSHFKETMEFDLKPELLRREIELLILRGILPYKIQGNKLLLS